MANLKSFLTSLDKNNPELKSDIVILTSSDEEAMSIQNYLRFFSKHDSYYFPSFDSLPYDRTSPSNKILSSRAEILGLIANSIRGKIIVTNAVNLIPKMAEKSLYKNRYIKLEQGRAISSAVLEKFLIDNGYLRQSTAIDSGDYSIRGHIVDIVTFDGSGFRVIFDWDKIEKIRKFDPETQISSAELSGITINLSSELLLNNEALECFKRNYLQNFGVQKSNEIYFERTMEGIKLAGIENFAPAFYINHSNLLEYFDNPKLYRTKLVDQAIYEYEEQVADFYNARLSSSSFFPAFKPDLLYEKSEVILKKLDHAELMELQAAEGEFLSVPNFVHLSQIDTAGQTVNQTVNQAANQTVNQTASQLFFEFIREKKPKKICIFCSSISNLDRIKSLLKLEQAPHIEVNHFMELEPAIINIAFLNSEQSFYNKEYLFISDREIILEKKPVARSSKKRLQNLFREIENFTEGDLIVHVDHGIGQYEGIEQLEINNIRHDCLKLKYARGDKLFIPVENIDLIKKYGDGIVELDYLGSVSWQKRKARQKDRIGALAKILIDNAALRSLVHPDPVEYDKARYAKFCDQFAYSETDDQLSAIEDILNDLEQGKLLDRLICGDVGFGKTEIAMRAAFLIGERKQVAVIVPTTILSRQHYNNFLERFRGFDYKIRQLSRFVSNKEAEKIREELALGEVDIIIGTHALLAENIKFKDLGLVIIDEEQHFGVTQKEKLKLISQKLHCLTLTATPIPRTLQMSLIGIRDLSLIATPPIDRLSVKTNVVSFDDIIIREAILREKLRGGKSFFVCPRISDIKDISEKLQALIPEAKFAAAHGKLSTATIDQIMTDFYEGKFDVLLSTAIVESGLDIPSANTMIVYKAEMFGLSQLYQLRGRVGRGKVRGYTYLVTDNKKPPSKSAIKILNILESIDTLGAGFSIASHDMDIRGFGNIIGDEQSGHIKEVGVELYQEMLEEAVSSHKKQDKIEDNDAPDIKINIPIYIPEDYISDSALRLSIYRRIGDLKIISEVEEFQNELLDRFGPIPETVDNLLSVIRLKINCKELKIKSLEIGTGGINVQFAHIDDPGKLLIFISKQNQANAIKIKPDNRISYRKNLTNSTFLSEAQLLLQEIATELYSKR